MKKSKNTKIIRASDGSAEPNPDAPNVNPFLPPMLDGKGVTAVPAGTGRDAIEGGLAAKGLEKQIGHAIRGEVDPRVPQFEAEMLRVAVREFEALPQPNAPRLDPDCGARLAPMPSGDSLASMIAASLMGPRR